MEYKDNTRKTYKIEKEKYVITSIKVDKTFKRLETKSIPIIHN